MKATIWKLIGKIQYAWKSFTIGMIFLLLSSLGTQLAPFVIQKLLDEEFILIAQSHELPMRAIFSGLILYIGILMLSNSLQYGASRLLMFCANQVVATLRTQAYQRMQKLPISYFDDKPAGKISTRIVNDTETLRRQFYGNMLSQVVVTLAPVVVIYLIIFSMDFRVGLVMLSILPLVIVWQKGYQKLTKEPVKEFYNARSEVNAQVSETMDGHLILQLFGQENTTKEEFDRISQKMFVTDYSINRVDASLSWSLSELMKRTIFFVLFALLGYQFLQGISTISAGYIFIYVGYISRLFDSLSMLVRQLPNLQRSIETGQRVIELLEAPVEEDASDSIDVNEGNVQFDHVSFAYEEGHEVLRDISFQVNKGESLALVGHTGSGKSSIMNLLFRFYDPQEGRIWIDQQDISHYNRESIRQEMGIVLQDPYLFSGTIASNVSMNNPDITRDQIEEALRKVGAQAMLQRLEKGIDEPVVEKGNSFSSGEKQLIAFARTLVADPKILILDEATAHIDTETEEIIQRAMDVVKEGRTTFIIAHRLSTIQDADQILVLDQGRIVEHGTHQELLEAKGTYSEMYQIQQAIS